MQIDIEKAKTTLSELLDAAEHGEEVVLTRDDRPIARLLSLAGESAPRRFGSARGLVTMSEDFDALPDDFAEHSG